MSSAYLRLFIFFPQSWFQLVLHPFLNFSWYYSAYKLNKQSDSILPWHTPFPIWNQSVVPCPVLTVASWPAYRFLRRQVRWSGIPISLRIFHSLLKVMKTINIYGWFFFLVISSNLLMFSLLIFSPSVGKEKSLFILVPPWSPRIRPQSSLSSWPLSCIIFSEIFKLNLTCNFLVVQVSFSQQSLVRDNRKTWQVVLLT